MENSPQTSVGIDFSRQNLTVTDVRLWGRMSISTMKGLKSEWLLILCFNHTDFSECLLVHIMFMNYLPYIYIWIFLLPVMFFSREFYPSCSTFSFVQLMCAPLFQKHKSESYMFSLSIYLLHAFLILLFFLIQINLYINCLFSKCTSKIIRWHYRILKLLWVVLNTTHQK